MNWSAKGSGWFVATAIFVISREAAADCDTACASVALACENAPELVAAGASGVPGVLEAAVAVVVVQYVATELCGSYGTQSCQDVVTQNCSGDGCVLVCQSANKLCDALLTTGKAALAGEEIPWELVNMAIGWVNSGVCEETCKQICSNLVPAAGGDLCDLAVTGDGVCGFPEYGNACAMKDKDCCVPGTCGSGDWCLQSQGIQPHGVCGPCDGCKSLVCKSYNECVKACSDGVQGPGEEGIDCGGPCSSCATKQPTCSDGVQNQARAG